MSKNLPCWFLTYQEMTSRLLLNIIFILQLLPFSGQCLDTTKVENVISRMENTLDHTNKIQYSGRMLFKEFGNDTFEVKDFNIYYKINYNNKTYGHDYAITQILNDGYAFTFMTSENNFYLIDEKSKSISKKDLEEFVHPGNYFENKKNTLLIADIIQPFLLQPLNSITLQESKDTILLSYKVDEAINEIYILKSTFLPVKYVNTIRESELGLIQTLETNFYNVNTYYDKIDSVFNLKYFTSRGYSLEDKTTARPELISPISTTFQSDILNYNFVNSTGDTINLSKFTNDYIVLEFWYASCLPCLKALPKLDTIAEIFAQKDVLIFGLNCYDKGIKENLHQKLSSKIRNITFLYGERDLLLSHNISSFPSYYLVLPNRNILQINGGVEKVKESLELYIKNK